MWWKVFGKSSPREIIIPFKSLGGLWTLGYFVALCALMGILGTSSLPQLVLPVALCGLYIFLTCLTGEVGMVVFMPLLAYGWLCLGWYLAQGGAVTGRLAALEGLLVALIVAVVLVIAPHACARLLVPVLAEVAFFGCMCYGIFWTQIPELKVTVRGMGIAEFMPRVIYFYFTGITVMALVVVVMLSLTDLHSLTQHSKEKRRLLWDAGLFAAGLVVVLLGSLLAPTSAPLAIVVVVLCHAGIAAFVTGRQEGHAGWALLPLVLFGALAVIGTAPLDYLPPYELGNGCVRALHEGPVAQAAQFVAGPLVDAFGSVFGGLVVHVSHSVLVVFERLGHSASFALKPLFAALEDAQNSYLESLGELGELGNVPNVDVQNIVTLAWGLEKLPVKSRLVKALSLYMGSLVSCAVAGAAVWVVEKTVLEKKRKELEALMAQKRTTSSPVVQPASKAPVVTPAGPEVPAYTDPTVYEPPAAADSANFKDPAEPGGTEGPGAEVPDWPTFNVARKSRPKTRVDERVDE